MRKIKEHWLKYLPDVGRIKEFYGDKQESRLQEINRLKQQIKALEAEYKESEAEIEKIVLSGLDGWNLVEVSEAKAKAKKYDSYRQYIDCFLRARY